MACVRDECTLSTTHYLDRPQGQPREYVARKRGQQQCQRSTDKQDARQVADRLIAVVQRLADDSDELAGPGH